MMPSGGARPGQRRASGREAAPSGDSAALRLWLHWKGNPVFFLVQVHHDHDGPGLLACQPASERRGTERHGRPRRALRLRPARAQVPSGRS
jgi:hypothetical protein